MWPLNIFLVLLFHMLLDLQTVYPIFLLLGSPFCNRPGAILFSKTIIHIELDFDRVPH